MLRRTVVFWALMVGMVLAQTPAPTAGTASNLFLRSSISARVSGLGDAFTGGPFGEDALYYNPAGLAILNKFVIGFNHTRWFEDIRFDNLTLAFQLHQRLAMAVGVSYMSMPEIQGKDVFGQPTEMLSVSSGVAHLGMAFQFHPAVYGGVTVKYFRDQLAQFTATGIAVDVGYFMYTLIEGLSLGVTVQNIGGSVQYFREKQPIPLTVRAGLAYRFYPSRFQISLDAVKSIDTDVHLNLGVEYVFQNLFALRLGNQFRRDEVLRPSLGVGLQVMGNYMINYTYAALTDLGETHRIGLTLGFKKPRRYRKRYSPARDRYVLAPGKKLVITARIDSNRLVIKWPEIKDATYNVYARAAGQMEWKKVNKHPLTQNHIAFKKPARPGIYYFKVSVIKGNREIDLADEVQIHVQ
ncbi:MAG: PorV/PorQ family protein [Calditrichaeota bacterium]|nr:PorV/PorQ family protein [Calditrichota bacterium]